MQFGDVLAYGQTQASICFGDFGREKGIEYFVLDRFRNAERGFASVETYRQLYKPFHKRLNDREYRNTGWKTLYHICGSIVSFLDDFADAGINILNPVQCSAAGMDPKMLKDKYGKRFTFWDGGYVFNTIHNIVGKTPVENLVAMFETVKDFNRGRL